MQKTDSIFLFEHPKDIEILKSNLDKNDTVIALNQYADFELEKNNIPHLLFEGDIFTSKKFYDDLYYFSYEWILKLTNKLDKNLFDVDNRFKAENFNVFYLFYNYFYYMIQPCQIAAYDIYNLCKSNQIK